MRMGQGVRTGLGHGGITCVLQTQFSSFSLLSVMNSCKHIVIIPPAYEVCHGGIMFSSFLCVCVCVSVNNFRVRSITLKRLDIFS